MDDEELSSDGERLERWEGSDSRKIWSRLRKCTHVNAVTFDPDECGSNAAVRPRPAPRVPPGTRRPAAKQRAAHRGLCRRGSPRRLFGLTRLPRARPQVSDDRRSVAATGAGASAARAGPPVEQTDRDARVHYFEARYDAPPGGLGAELRANGVAEVEAEEGRSGHWDPHADEGVMTQGAGEEGAEGSAIGIAADGASPPCACRTPGAARHGTARWREALRCSAAR
jgi:hypothetical protein